jgi:DNA mismatch repair ATPase MutS
MKAFLMYRDRDFDLERELPWQAGALTQDLGLDTLFQAMALEDKFLLPVARQAVLSGLANDPDTIRYRQAVLQDCLKHAAVVREMYAVTEEAIAAEKKVYFGFYGRYPAGILARAVEVLQLFMSALKRLRRSADERAGQFESDGFAALFAMLQAELDDDFFATVQAHLNQLKFRDGVLVSAELGIGAKGANYRLRKPAENRRGWIQRIFAKRPSAYTLTLHERDDNGARALAELRDRGINLVGNALAQSTDHILGFFVRLRTELAFYIGCLNLHGRLSQLGEPICFPRPAAGSECRLAAQGLYDVCLALVTGRPVVGNDLPGDHKRLVLITGANQGGKSTFLRSVGLAQLMMQAGMFAPAEAFAAHVCDGLFTHFKREEDASMQSGKLDEELARMSELVDRLTPNAMLLCNESFAATNVREGAEIARQIVTALLEHGVRILFVTHLFEFARRFYDQGLASAVFLRADRQADGRRTFRLVEGEPLDTSYGKDLYDAIFGAARRADVDGWV